MKRYLLFAGDTYYPSGGWSDFHSDHDTIEEALAAKNGLEYIDWYQIVDSTTVKVVA